MPRSVKRLPPEVRLEALVPAVEPAAAPPGFFERRRDAPVAARQNAFEQAQSRCRAA